MRDRLVLVDISTKKFKSISYKQYDVNNLLQIVVMENNSIVNISNYVATAYFEMPSGNIYQINGTINNNTINVLLSEQILSEYGRVMVEVELVNFDQIVTTFTFYLNVEKSINRVGVSNPNPQPPQQTYHTHSNLDVLNQITQEMIDNIGSSGGLVDLSVYQTKKDTTLETDNKTVSGAINELNEKIENASANIDLSDYALKSEIPTVPTKVSQLQNDKGYLTEHQDISEKANKSDIPTKTSQLTNDSDFATNSSVDEKIANANTGGTVDLTSYAKKTDIPTKTSQLQNDSGFITEHQDISNKADKSEIPTKTSQLANDNNFISSIPSEYITEIELEAKGYLTQHQDISNKADKSEIPTKTSQLQNDSNFINSIPSEYITETELNAELSTKANKSDIPSLNGYATETYVTNKIAEASLSGGEVDLSGYATKDDLSTKSNVDHTHTMSNITDLVIPDVDKDYVDTQLNTKANKSDIPIVPTKVSDLTNDSGYITEVPSEYVTETELNSKGYLTEHQDLSNYQTKEDNSLTTNAKMVTDAINELNTNCIKLGNDLDDTMINIDENILTKISSLESELNNKLEIDDLSNYYNKTEVDKKIIDAVAGGAVDLSDYAKTSDIPTKTSDLVNDSGFLTSIPNEYITETELDAKGYLTEHQDISGKANKSYVDTELAKKSDATHTHSYNDLSDKPTIPSIDGLATKKELTDGLAKKSDITHTHDQYLTEHQDLSNYALKTELPTVPTKVSQLQNDSNFISSIPEEYVTEQELNSKGLATETFVNNKIAEAQLGGDNSEIDLSGYVTKGVGNANQITFRDGQTFQAKLDAGLLKGADGTNGITFTPGVDTNGNLSWTNDGGLINPTTVNIKGAKGDKGDKGDTGLQGIQGLKGDKGEKGDKGDSFTYADFTQEQLAQLKGERGEQGIQGEKGDKGEQGLKGDKGEQGIQGEQGLPGADGLTTSISVNGNTYTHVEGTITLPNYPTVPSKTSQLTNDSGYLTSIPNEYITESELNSKGYLTEHQDISGKADKSEIPTKTSQLTNNSGFLTSIPSEYVTETELNAKGYATTSQIPTSLPANGGNASTVGGYTIWVGTQSQYDAIATKSSTTIYLIKE